MKTWLITKKVKVQAEDSYNALKKYVNYEMDTAEGRRMFKDGTIKVQDCKVTEVKEK